MSIYYCHTSLSVVEGGRVCSEGVSKGIIFRLLAGEYLNMIPEFTFDQIAKSFRHS